MKYFKTVLLIIALLSVVYVLYYSELRSSNETIKQTYTRVSEKWPKPFVDKGVEWQEIGSLPDFKEKLNNDEVTLGKQLFFDTRLSKSNKVSCASCHNPKLGWQDAKEKSPGHDSIFGDRNTPSILNMKYFKTFFWDGRAKTLEDQVAGPLTNPKEMNISIEELIEKLNKTNYKKQFKKVYGVQDITPSYLYKAIATFEKSIFDNQTRFDKFIKGDTTAMNNKELRGMHLFRTKARCMNCHNGALFTDQKFHNLGLVYYKRKYEDLGRYHITTKANDVGKFRTPTLRNVMNTGPWMHNGFVWEMEGVLSMYNAGMVKLEPTKEEVKDTLFPYTSNLLKPLNLSYKEQQEIIAFLKTLNTN